MSKKTLQLSILKAKELAAKDKSGKSDPFVKIKVGGHKKKTKVVKQELNPEWHEMFYFDDVDERVAVHLKVYDWDRIGSDEFMGEITIPQADLDAAAKGPVEKWYPLQRRKVKEEVTGEINIKFLYLEKPSVSFDPKASKANLDAGAALAATGQGPTPPGPPPPPGGASNPLLPPVDTPPMPPAHAHSPAVHSGPVGGGAPPPPPPPPPPSHIGGGGGHRAPSFPPPAQAPHVPDAPHPGHSGFPPKQPLPHPGGPKGHLPTPPPRAPIPAPSKVNLIPGGAPPHPPPRSVVETHPQARVEYAFVPESERELACNEGDILDILEEKGEWIKAKKQDGTQGWLPANYVTKL